MAVRAPELLCSFFVFASLESIHYFLQFCIVKNLDLDSVLFYGLLLVFAIVYLYMFPQGWLISDEYSYVNQAIAISEGNTYLSFSEAITDQEVPYNFTPYSMGNSFWLAIWIKLFSLKNIYLGSLFAILAGTFFLYKAIKRAGYYIPALGLVFLYPALIFFASSTMSAVPSYLLCCIFIYGLFTTKESRWKWFWLCALASFSFWVRETNIVILGGVCFIHFLGDRRWLGYYFIGALIGFLPRLITSYYFYGDPFYYLLAEPFSLFFILDNIVVYAILTLLCMPLGLFFLGAYKGVYRWPIIISSFMFFFLYLTYRYNAIAYSGFRNGWILMGRFLMPLLPFFVLTVSWYFRKFRLNNYVVGLWFTVVVFAMAGMNYKINQEALVHKEVSVQIYDRYGQEHVFFDLSRRTNILRYLNPMQGKFLFQSDITKLKDEDYMYQALQSDQELYVAQTINTVNLEKSGLTQSVQTIIDSASLIYSLSTVKLIKIKPGLKIEILKVQKQIDQN